MKFTFEISCDNSSFNLEQDILINEDTVDLDEIKKCFEKTYNKLSNSFYEGKIYDSNGNNIGKYYLGE